MNTNDSLRTIYKEIIQPLIGDFFEVDAAFPPTNVTTNHQFTYEDDDAPCLCCGSRNYRSTSVSARDGSARSEGKFYIYFERKIYLRNLMIIFIFSVNRNSK
jgi:hypothetical protein